MKYFLIKLEVPAGIGKNSILERIPGQALKAVKLHLVIEDWLGSDLMKTSSVFYVTEKSKKRLVNSNLTGIEGFEEMEVSKSENFLELYPNKKLPRFLWFKINGEPRVDDFGVEKGKLIVSDRVKNFYLESVEYKLL